MRSFQVCTCGAPLECVEAPERQARRHRGAAQGAGRRRLPQRPASVRRLFRSWRRQEAQHRRARHETAGDARPRERRRGGGGRAGRAQASRSATGGWSIRGRAAANAASAGAATSSFARSHHSIGVFRNGGYSTHLLVPHPRYLFDIGDIPPERAAPLACSGVTTYSALKKVGPTLSTDPTVIIGAGGLGLMCLALHKAMGGHSADRGRHRCGQAGSGDEGRRGRRDRRQRARRRSADRRRDRRRRLGGDRSRRLVFHRAARPRQPDQGRQAHLVGLYGGEITLSLPPFPMRAIAIQGSYIGSLTETKELIELVRAPACRRCRCRRGR